MFYTQIIENNKSDLNSLLIFDVLSQDDVIDFIRRNGQSDKISEQQIIQKWHLIDYHLQKIKTNRADEDLKKALKETFKFELLQSTTREKEQQKTTR